MKGHIPEEKIAEIRERTDIVEVVSSYLPLKRSGGNHKGLCPFHDEKTPSFNVNAPRQIFHCFGCGVGGDVISFLMRIEGLTFVEAIRRLGERAGIEVEEEVVTPAEMKRREEAARFGKINNAAAEFYHQILLEAPEGGPARSYLRARGYDGEAARRFKLGFAPGRWDSLCNHLAEKGFDSEEVKKLGLIRTGKEGRGDYDLFRNRLLFPIQNLSGDVVAFGGRVLDDSLPKYINSPESPVYHKSRVLYGLEQAREGMRRKDEGIIVEGYFDQIALARAGFTNTVATCGTALTREHAKLLKRYAGRLLLLFDQDGAGQKATMRAMEELLPEGLSVAVVGLDAGEDPDSFLAGAGAEVFRERLDAARPVLEVFIDLVFDRCGTSIEGKARAVEEIVSKLKLLPSEIERNLYLGALAERSGLDQALLRQKMESLGKSGTSRPSSRELPPEPPPQQDSDWQVPDWEPPVQQAPNWEPPARQGTSRQGPNRERSPEGPEEKFQQWLLKLMAHEEVLAQVEEKGVENYFLDGAYKDIANAFLAVEGEPCNRLENLLEGALIEPQKAIVSGILKLDEGAFSENPKSILEGCEKAAVTQRLNMRTQQLMALIRDAETQGDADSANAYRQEFIEINRKLKSGNY